MNPRLSVIIVTHNNKKLIKPLLESLFSSINHWKKKTEIIIVDNASSDNTVEFVKDHYPGIIILSSKHNNGYAWANNQGLKIAKGDYVLLLNSDTRLSVNTIKTTISYLDNNPKVGVVTCKLILKNGQIDPACHRGFPTPWAAFTYFSGLEKLFPRSAFFTSYHLLTKPLNTIHEIDSPSGAFFLTRKKVVNQVGLLDEDFFMYGEDLDWSYRIKKKGWKIIYNPCSTVLHLKKQSGINNSNKAIKQKALIAFYDAMKIFYKKHYLKKYPFFITQLIFTFVDFKKRRALSHHQ